jgi:hypothetical protein
MLHNGLFFHVCMNRTVPVKDLGVLNRTAPVNITIIIDRSFQSFGVVKSAKLYSLLCQVLENIWTHKKRTVKYRFGAFGATACFLSSDDGPFKYSLKSTDAPHEVVTAKSKVELIEALQGQPFPLLGVCNIRDVLQTLFSKQDPLVVADHVVVIASWTPSPITTDTWLVMQQTGSVSLVNLEQPVPSIPQDVSLKSIWFVSDNTAFQLCKQMRKALKHTPTPQFKVQSLTSYEMLHISMLVFLKERAPFYLASGF